MAQELLLAKAAIQRTFREINTDARPDTCIPAGSKNTSTIAARFLVAELGRSYWNKEYEEAKKAAFEAGILGSEEDYIEGETVVTWNCPAFDVTAKKAASTEVVDKTMLKNALDKHATPKVRDAVLSESFKPRKGAVTISTVIK